MNIQPIQQASFNPAFNAKLKVNSNVYSTVRTSRAKLDTVIDGFRTKLANDPLNRSDVVELRKITGEPKRIITGSHTYTPGHYESNGYGGTRFVRDKIRGCSPYEFMGGYHDAPDIVCPTYSSEDLEIAINRSKTGFCYNDNRSAEQIAEDMYNAYKHVRYLEHYAK